jgi:hypothetical protein
VRMLLCESLCRTSIRACFHEGSPGCHTVNEPDIEFLSYF